MSHVDTVFLHHTSLQMFNAVLFVQTQKANVKTQVGIHSQELRFTLVKDLRLSVGLSGPHKQP